MSETEQTTLLPWYDSEVSMRDILRPLWLREWLISNTEFAAALRLCDSGFVASRHLPSAGLAGAYQPGSRHRACRRRRLSIG